MKVLSVILKIIETGIVCVWGVFFGIFFPAVILISGEDVFDIAAHTGLLVLWLVTCTAGYLLPAALILGKHYRIAAALSVAGFIALLVINSQFAVLYVNNPDSRGPSELYMPLIFATILDIIILAVEERANIAKLLAVKKAEKEAKAPSILGEDKND